MLPGMADDETKPIPSQGQLTERERQIAHGLALVRGGLSYQRAGKEAGIPTMSLFEAAQRGYTDPAVRESALEAAEKRIEAQVTLISEAAGDRVLTALAEGSEVPKSDAVLYGIATDKIVRMRGLDRQQDRSGSALESVLDRLADLNLEASITVKPAEHPSIDVTPEPERD
jgi:hypothetical protein